jgi:hypothetical protein
VRPAAPAALEAWMIRNTVALSAAAALTLLKGFPYRDCCEPDSSAGYHCERARCPRQMPALI